MTDELGAEAEATRVAAIKELLDRGLPSRNAARHGDGDAAPVAITFEWASTLPEATSAATTVTAAALEDEGSDAAIFTWDSSC